MIKETNYGLAGPLGRQEMNQAVSHPQLGAKELALSTCYQA
jgi:hypothetical protein